jgi:tetratricopeptide (TPR) repeat protein
MGQKLSTLSNCFRKACCCKKKSKQLSELCDTKLDSSVLLPPLTRRIDYFNLQIPTNHYKDLVLIWLDEQIDVDLENTIQMKNLLEQINEHTQMFSKKEEFFNYLSSVTNQIIFLIISGQVSINVLPLIADNQHIHTVYIFCIEDYRYKDSINDYSKLRGVFIDHKNLIQEIQRDIRIYMEQLMKFNLLNTEEQKSIIELSLESSEFLWCYVVKDVLVNIDTINDAKKIMIDYCRTEYKTNSAMLKQIDDFEKNYKPEDAIQWYTKDSFLYRLLNKLIRTENINALFKFKFFITDLSLQLKQKWENDYGPNYCESVKLYRGAELTDAERQKLKCGSLISPNGYMSTSMSFETACIYAINTIFEIEINPLVENLIFANIAEFSEFPQEEEVLFDLGCTFRITSVNHDDQNQRLVVKMIAVNEAEKLANTFIKTINEKKKTKGYLDGLISDFVHKLGYQKGLVLYQHFLTLSIHDRQKIMNNCARYLKLYERCCDAANVTILYGCFGWFFTQRAEYDLAIKYCNRALLLIEKKPSSNNIGIELAMIHNTIGWSYYEKEDYELALEWCLKAKKILGNCSYIEYSKYAKVLKSEEKLRECSSRNDAEFAEILTNLGCIYCKKSDFEMAIAYCTKSMVILENFDTQMIFSDPHGTPASSKELDNHHETMAANYEVLADINYQRRDYARALEYYNKALNIFETITPRIPICLQRSPYIFGRNKQRLQNSLRLTETQMIAEE